jgi:hypothetical protein
MSREGLILAQKIVSFYRAMKSRFVVKRLCAPIMQKCKRPYFSTENCFFLQSHEKSFCCETTLCANNAEM